MKYSKEELKSAGFTDEQIDVIYKQIEADDSKESDKVINISNHNVKELNDSDVTSIVDLQKYASGNIVELPSFDGEHPFIVKLKRPSLLVMVKTGKIPNSLINQATELFQKGANSLGKDNTVSDMYDIIQSICEAALVSPSYKEIKDAGITLTDEQMMAIFSYTQQGVKALERFRTK